MSEPQKPFACTMPDCDMAFTNEDHLNVHIKKHDMVLQLGSEQKAAFVADQTPTPTRFIRNCDEIGLFQDLQNVNPFDETFKRAMDAKAGHALDSGISSSVPDDVLHTPQMIPMTDGDTTLYSSTNNKSNVVISRSSSDESGVVKEFETTTISKLTNEVTISKIINKQDMSQVDGTYSNENRNINESVLFTNNVIKIHSNIEVKKGNVAFKQNMPIIARADVVTNIDKPLMSQKSINNVIDSLTAFNDKSDSVNIDEDCVIVGDENNEKVNVNEYENITKNNEDLEVVIKLPGRKKYIKMKPIKERVNAKDKLKNAILEKHEQDKIIKVKNNMIQIPAGTFIPVTVLNPIKASVILPSKLPIPASTSHLNLNTIKPSTLDKVDNKNGRRVINKKVIENNLKSETKEKILRINTLEMRSAAAKRYRDKMKLKMLTESQENERLKLENSRMTLEIEELKRIIKEHVKKCSNCDDLGMIYVPMYL